MSYRSTILLLTTCLLAACSAPVLPDGSENTMVLGHGGMGFGGSFSDYIPNSKQSFETAIAGRFHGVEADVQITGDGQLALFHDEKLEDCTSCTGLISEMRWEDISECNYTGFFGGPKGNLWNLDSLMICCQTRKVMPWVSLDVKLYGNDKNRMALAKRTAEALDSAMHRWGDAGYFIVESRSPEFLKLMLKSKPQCLVFYSCNSVSEGIAEAKKIAIHGLCVPLDKLNEEQAAIIRDMGLKLIIWGASTNGENRQALSYRPDFLETDDGDILTLFPKRGGDER